MQDLEGLFLKAVHNGALVYYESRIVERWENGHRMEVRLCPGLKHKPAVANQSGNPFLPCDERLFIENIGQGHVLLFNKFSVIQNHLLLVTREFRPQTADLDDSDFRAINAFYDIYGPDWIMFYNCGPLSGASQPHRHIQFVPKWEGCGPLAGSIVNCSLSGLQSAYRTMTKDLNSHSFNAIFSPSWFAIIVRRQEKCSLGVSMNAMAFLGSILVKTETDLERVCESKISDLIDEVIQ